MFIAKIDIKECTECIFFQEFMVLGLAFKSLIKFAFIFVYGIRWSLVSFFYM